MTGGPGSPRAAFCSPGGSELQRRDRRRFSDWEHPVEVMMRERPAPGRTAAIGPALPTRGQRQRRSKTTATAAARPRRTHRDRRGPPCISLQASARGPMDPASPRLSPHTRLAQRSLLAGRRGPPGSGGRHSVTRGIISTAPCLGLLSARKDGRGVEHRTADARLPSGGPHRSRRSADRRPHRAQAYHGGFRHRAGHRWQHPAPCLQPCCAGSRDRGSCGWPRGRQGKDESGA